MASPLPEDRQSRPALTGEELHHGLEPPREGEQGLWFLVNDRLSGRWKPAIAMGLALAAVVGWFGYRSGTPVWESAGLISISPKVTPIMRETPETGAVPFFSGYVQAQATLLTSTRVIEHALRSLDPAELPWQGHQEARVAIQRGLLAAPPERNSELILVKYRAHTPELAQAVVNAVLRSYDELRGTADTEEINRKLKTLRGIRESLRATQRQKQSQLRELIATSDFAAGDIRSLMHAKNLLIQEYEIEMRRVRHSLATVADARHDEAGEAIIEVDFRDLELFDEELARLGRLREQYRLEYEVARQRTTPNNLAYKNAKRDYELLDIKYRERQSIVMQQFLDSGQGVMGAGAAEAQLEQLQFALDTERDNLRRMNQVNLAVDELRTELDELQVLLADYSARIRDLETEAEAVRARIAIAAWGDRPLAPARDQRRALAMVGAMGGVGAGFAFFFLLGTVDRRVYAARQITASGAGQKLLGVLPALPRKPGDLEASGIAAHCVHQIRNQIESLRRDGGLRSLVVSSPYQGDGKTSLTLALGASYAAAGCRTLLMDCDFVGRSLTHHLGMTGQFGLMEALKAGAVDGYIKPVQADNLNMLPVGNNPNFGPEHLRREDMTVLLEQLRDRFDIVLIDTGPMFGSVESLPVAAAADGIILTMWRGRRHARLIECIESLRAVDARYLGLVLNYADAADCNHYVSASHTSSLFSGQDGKGRPGAGVQRLGRNGSRNALLRAMQATSRRDHAQQGSR